jgi:[protein-PII] uridylyltransferase
LKLVKAHDIPPLVTKEFIEHQCAGILCDKSLPLQDKRQKLLQILTALKQDIDQSAEDQLLKDGGGLACSQRLSDAQDCLIEFLYDTALAVFYPCNNPSDAEKIALCAIGGYGRGTLAPQSDIDLLFLRPYKQTAWGEQVVEWILYMLWDLGFKVGHATRTLDECIAISKSDMTARTALVEARYIIGEKNLFKSLIKRFQNEIVLPDQGEFIQAKLEERDKRHDKHGVSRYLVEPNVKESKGGLRDLHTLYWIGKYHYHVRHPSELVKKKVFSRTEYNRFLKCEDFLWATRCHLHFETKRAEERLSFDLQPVLARRLGYVAEAGLKDVERFMKHYFLCAKDVGDLTRIVCASVEQSSDLNQANLLEKIVSPLKRNPKIIKDSKDFTLDRNRLHITSADVFEKDPVNLIRFFNFFDQLNVGLHPDAMRTVTRSLKYINADLRQNKIANNLFLDILTSSKNPEKTLRRMNESGVLGRFIPDFGKIVAMMQFNMYHHYTVDEHLIRSVGILSDILKGTLAEEHPLAHSLLDKITHHRALFVAMFLHDIAKGRPEDHSVAGSQIALKLCPRFGLDEEETELVSWLVKDHLLMSMTAQNRDLADRKTIADFATHVQTIERLRLLLILTVADIKAVGPGVWNGWKGQLLRTLYYQTEVILTGGHSELEPAARAKGARESLLQSLSDWPEQDTAHIINLHSNAYWLRVEQDSQINHARMIRKADQNKQDFAYEIKTHNFEAVTELTIFTQDHPRLLSLIAGACTLSGANIVDAQIYTTTDGRALDSIFIRRAFDMDEDEVRRAGRIVETVQKALKGEQTLDERLDSKRKKKKSKPFKLKPKVTLSNTSSEYFTVIEANGLDRTGLLHDLTEVLSTCDLNITSAHISTFGERAVDTFYVLNKNGHKITQLKQINKVCRQLEQVFG